MMKRTNSLWHYLALLLLANTMAGCALSTRPASAGEERIAAQPPVRVIIYFQQPAKANPQLAGAISEACLCQPVFFRPYGADALIYEIALPQKYPYASFEAALMKHAARLGIKLLEQDRMLQHQQ